MLAVPLVSLLALWGFAASITVSAAIKDQAYNASSKTTNAGVYGLVSELPQERAQTYVWLLSGRRAPRAPLARRAEAGGPGGAPGQDRARRDRGNTQPGARRADRRPGTDPLDPQGRRRRDDEPVGRVPGVQQHRRRGIPLLPLDRQRTERRRARRHLGRRRRRGVRAGDGEQGGRAHRRHAERRRPPDSRHQGTVRGRRGAAARATRRDPGAGPRWPVSQLRQRLSGLPAVPGHGDPDTRTARATRSRSNATDLAVDDHGVPRVHVQDPEPDGRAARCRP